MAAPTSAMTTADLVLAVAKLLDVAWYGLDGQNSALVPIARKNLELCFLPES